jgi:hypothetical protein
MAFMFTHCYIAGEVLKKIKKKNLFSDFNNIDDYYFGAIAPDIRYVNNSKRNITHIPFGKERVLDNSRFGKYSKAFLAGYETHLIVDNVWANDKNWLDKSIYEFYNVNPNNTLQKFLLYGVVDDYFQGKSNWFSQLTFMGNVFRSDNFNLLNDLGFDVGGITLYKTGAATYLREPGIDTINIFSFITLNLEEKIIGEMLDRKNQLTSFLKDFKKVSIEKCVGHLEEKL